MAQPLSEHDEDLGSIDDFAPEQPAVQPIDDDLELHADLEPVALRLPDTRRDAGNARSWFVGILVLLIVGGVWLGWRAIPPAAAPSEMTAKPIASSTVERQPIERPGIAPPVPSSSEPDRAVSVDRSTPPVEKPRPAPVEKPRSASRRETAVGARRETAVGVRRETAVGIRRSTAAACRETAAGTRRGTTVGARRWFPGQGRRKAVSAAIACRRVAGQSSYAWSRDSARPESAASGAHWRRGSIGTRGRP